MDNAGGKKGKKIKGKKRKGKKITKGEKNPAPWIT